MNKEDIQNKINQLEKELNELKNKITDSTWEPYKNGYYIDSNGYCYEVEGLCHKYPAPHNCFRTRGLAELRAKQREAEDELFNIWEYLVDDWRPDWSDNKNLKYCVEYHRGNIKVNANFSVSDRPLYRFFPTAELARRQYELASDHTRAYMRGEF